jgi:hypothetical protein
MTEQHWIDLTEKLEYPVGQERTGRNQSTMSTFACPTRGAGCINPENRGSGVYTLEQSIGIKQDLQNKGLDYEVYIMKLISSPTWELYRY